MPPVRSGVRPVVAGVTIACSVTAAPGVSLIGLTALPVTLSVVMVDICTTLIVAGEVELLGE